MIEIGTKKFDTKAYFTGRPRKFTRAKFLEHVQTYFNTTPRKEWRITGLAIHVDVSRSTIYQWITEKREFSDIIKRAVNLIEDKYSENCEKNGKAGDIFILKNMGWSDKQTVDLNVKNIKSLTDLADAAEE